MTVDKAKFFIKLVYDLSNLRDIDYMNDVLDQGEYTATYNRIQFINDTCKQILEVWDNEEES